MRINCLRIAKQLADFQILCLPGGFSYGDDIAAGRILGNQSHHHWPTRSANSALPAS